MNIDISTRLKKVLPFLGRGTEDDEVFEVWVSQWGWETYKNGWELQATLSQFEDDSVRYLFRVSKPDVFLFGVSLREDGLAMTILWKTRTIFDYPKIRGCPPGQHPFDCDDLLPF